MFDFVFVGFYREVIAATNLEVSEDSLVRRTRKRSEITDGVVIIFFFSCRLFTVTVNSPDTAPLGIPKTWEYPKLGVKM